LYSFVYELYLCQSFLDAQKCFKKILHFGKGKGVARMVCFVIRNISECGDTEFEWMMTSLNRKLGDSFVIKRREFDNSLFKREFPDLEKETDRRVTISFADGIFNGSVLRKIFDK
jgi:hypothetical protein